MSYPLLVTHFLERARALHPDKELVSYRSGREVVRYDYGRCAERVFRLAGALRRLGVGRGDRVATLAWNTHRHLELYFAVPLVGAVLHTVNIRLSDDDVGYVLRHAGDRLVFADPDMVPVVDRVRSRLGAVTVVVTDAGDEAVAGADVGYEQLVREGPALDVPADIDESDLAALCYTSGTTGRPKGVGYSHRTLFLHTFAACLADGHAVSERDTVLHVVPMFHANAWGIPFAATMAGARQVLPGARPTAPLIADLIERERVTYVGMVPTLAGDLLRHLKDSGGDLSSLRALVLGGSPPALDLIRAFEEDHGVPVFQGWGMTELAPMATFSRPLSSMGSWPAEARYRVTQKQGRLLPGLEWKLLDDEGAELPCDGKHAGELLVRGAWAATSYYRGESADSFQDGWLRTGDVATIDSDGYLAVVDRKKDLIKSGGEWISSVELEQALLSHPAVLEAAVVAVPHQRWQERPLAVVVPRPGHEPAATELRDHLAGRVVRWWLPERIVFADALPRTGVGKLDKRRLRARYGGGEASVGDS